MTTDKPHAETDPQRLQEDWFRATTALRAIGGGVWDYDVQTDVLHCNRRWHEIVGLDPDRRPVTTVEAFRRYIHPEDVEIATRVDLAELQRLVAEQERYVAEYRIVRPDGGVRRIRSVACLVDTNGALRAIGCITDVTDPDHLQREPDARALPAPAETLALTPHERECLWWVSYGKTAWETAGIIGRSPRTVEFHLANAIRKLGAANKVHAAVLAIRRGLL